MRQYEIIYETLTVERQFEELKDIRYEQNISKIDQKAITIRNEEAHGYQNGLKKISW